MPHLAAAQELGGPAPHEVYTTLLAHELRTPVTSIFAYLQLLSDERLLSNPDILRQYLSIVRTRAEGLARLVSELTDFADVVTRGELRPQGLRPNGLQELVSELGHGHALRSEMTEEALGAPIDLDPLATDISNAVSINDSGAIVGSVVTAAGLQHGFLYQNGKMTNLVFPSGGFAAP